MPQCSPVAGKQNITSMSRMRLASLRQARLCSQRTAAILICSAPSSDVRKSKGKVNVFPNMHAARTGPKRCLGCGRGSLGTKAIVAIGTPCTLITGGRLGPSLLVVPCLGEQVRFPLPWHQSPSLQLQGKERVVPWASRKAICRPGNRQLSRSQGLRGSAVKAQKITTMSIDMDQPAKTWTVPSRGSHSNSTEASVASV
eukprot:scaffold897_cov402-Prasinococcus_capsulatus_cf.AAC.51